MYFEGELRGKKYSLEVLESKDFYTVTIHPQGADKKVHKISKKDYQRMDNGINFLFENSSYMIDVVGEGLDYTVYTRGSFRTIRLLNDEALLHESLKTGGAMAAAGQLTSGMPGKIVEVMVKVGDEVKSGQTLLIMEAMKMENEMRAPRNAVIKEIKVTKGQSVESGATLIIFES